MSDSLLRLTFRVLSLNGSWTTPVTGLHSSAALRDRRRARPWQPSRPRESNHHPTVGMGGGLISARPDAARSTPLLTAAAITREIRMLVAYGLGALPRSNLKGLRLGRSRATE